MKGKVFLTILLVVVLMLTVTASAFAKGGNIVKSYRGSLVALNGSGVTGQVSITMLGNQQLKVSVWAYGLVSRRVHMQGLYGFADGTPAMVPPLTADTSGDGFISIDEAMAFTGPMLLDLVPHPVAKKSGRVEFTWVYRGAALKALNFVDGVPLNQRVFMIQGGFWTPTYGTMVYDKLLPVAAARIVGPSAK